MQNQPGHDPAPQVALFDLDGTLTWKDTLLPFLRGYLARYPGRLLRLWRMPLAVAGYLFGGRDRGVLKSRVIRAVMGGASRAHIGAWTAAYVDSLHARNAFRPHALAVLSEHRAAGHSLVLLSASPDLYVPEIGRLLGFDRTVCTTVKWRGDLLDGHLTSANRHGEEKVRCLIDLRRTYPDTPIVAYGNSLSDLAHLRQADQAVLVNGGSAARRLAGQFGIAAENWT